MKFAATTPHNLEWDQSDHTGVRRILALAHIDLLLLPFLSTVYVRLVHVNRQRRVQVLQLGITPLTRDIYQIHTGLLFCHGGRELDAQLDLSRGALGLSLDISISCLRPAGGIAEPHAGADRAASGAHLEGHVSHGSASGFLA